MFMYVRYIIDNFKLLLIKTAQFSLAIMYYIITCYVYNVHSNLIKQFK